MIRWKERSQLSTENIRCLRHEHNDKKPSAVLNLSGSDYIENSVYCYGCRKWYMSYSPEKSFHTYKDLVSNSDISFSPVKEKEYTMKYGSLTGLSKSKSRRTFYGQTLKSFIKDNTEVVLDNGTIIYPKKFPRVANDFVGTHETIKEFFLNEEVVNNRIDMNKGFYNRIIIDSDDEGDLLPRLKKITDISEVGGFWLILNQGNTKFQASINLMYSVLNGRDMYKVKEVSRYLNDLAGDDHMTGSFMKNAHHRPENNNSDLSYGAQKTRLYGFDLTLQTDYENRYNNSKWEKYWLPKINRKEIEVSFLSNSGGKGKDICVLIPPRNISWVMRRDKTWAQPIETLWANTVAKYKKVRLKNQEKYSQEEFSRKRNVNNRSFEIATSILKDIGGNPYRRIFSSIKFSMSKYVSKFKEGMRIENNFDMMFNIEATGLSAISDFLGSFENIKEYTEILQRLNKKGLISTKRWETFYSNWGVLLKDAKNNNLYLYNTLKNLSEDDIKIIFDLYPILSNIKEDVSKVFQGIMKNSNSQIQEIAAIANELVYYDSIDLLAWYDKRTMSKIEGSLKALKQSDYLLYNRILKQYVVNTILLKEGISMFDLLVDKVITEKTIKLPIISRIKEEIGNIGELLYPLFFKTNPYAPDG